MLGACNVIKNIPDDRTESEELQEFLAQIRSSKSESEERWLE